MNEKDPFNVDSDQETSTLEWRFCPICGKQLPNVQRLKFCTSCGTDIQYIKVHKAIKPTNISNPYKTSSEYSRRISPPIYYESELITDDNLVDNKDIKLWSTMTSIGLPIAALLIMNGIVGGFLTFLMLTSNDLSGLTDLATNSYLTSIISIFELVFFILPVFYVRKYLKNPTLKNRLVFLGFTTRNYDRKGIIREVLIGLSFAIIGVFIVSFSSIAIELIVEALFGVTIVHDTTGLTGEIVPPDILSLILFSVIVILIVGTSEEILFRGFMQKGLVRTIGNRWGILVTALIFSLIHLTALFFIALESPYLFTISFLLSFTPYFAISLMLGWLYYWRNENLIAVIITHGVYDVLAIVVTYLLYGLYL